MIRKFVVISTMVVAMAMASPVLAGDNGPKSDWGPGNSAAARGLPTPTDTAQVNCVGDFMSTAAQGKLKGFGIGNLQFGITNLVSAFFTIGPVIDTFEDRDTCGDFFNPPD